MPAPGRDRLNTVQNFPDPQQRALGGARRQCAGSVEAACDDLAVRLRRPVLGEIPDHEHRDMVAPRDMAVEEDAVQRGFAADRDAPFFEQLPLQRLDEGIIGPTPRESLPPVRCKK